MPATAPSPSSFRTLLTAGTIALAFFICLAPTLHVQEFSGGSENLNVETVLEMRRGGPWLVPNLLGRPRTIKPPITAWTTATFVSPATVASLSNPDQGARDGAYRRLAFQVRWPALALSCLMIAATFETGRLLAGFRAGIAAAVVAGSMVMFLRFGRMATTDTQLALWVALANVSVLHILFRGRWWLGCLAGGAAMGLAVMAKGPVAFAQTLAPFVVWGMWAAWRSGRGPRVMLRGNRRRILLPILAGIATMLLIATPWFAWVMLKNPHIVEAWRREVTRVGATNLEPDSWYNYWQFILWTFPWVLFFVVGLVMSVQGLLRGERRTALLLALFAVPILVMSCFSDKPLRYLQPLIVPAAVMVAVALQGQWRAWRERPKIDRDLFVAHFALLALAIVAVGVAAPFTKVLPDVNGNPWMTPATAAIVSFVGLAFLGGTAWLSLRRPMALLYGTAGLMLLVQVLAVHGYARSVNGRSDGKVVADYLWQTGDGSVDDIILYIPQFREIAPVDLCIYLNRLPPMVGTLDDVAQGSRVRAVLTRGTNDEPDPIPPGWQIDRQWTIGKHYWMTLVRTAPVK
jgi:4-amino-4-deoxy-L-arabinose transferase-like glycosyltransferase